MTKKILESEIDGAAVLADIERLLPQVQELLRQGRCDSIVMLTLRHALECVVEGRLPSYLRLTEGGEFEAELLQRILSIKIANAALSEAEKAWFHARHLLYLGEIYLVNFSGGRGNLHRGDLIKRKLEAVYGLPRDLSVIDRWSPPYWDEPDFLWALEEIIDEALQADKITLRKLHERGVHYVGQRLGKMRPLSPSEDSPSLMKKRVRGYLIRPATFVPSDWCPEVDVPLLWLEQQAERATQEDQLAQMMHRLGEGHGLTEGQISGLIKRVSECELTVRSQNCLAEAGIEYIHQLVERTEAELLKIKNFGRKSSNEINELLFDMGLQLGMKLAEDWQSPVSSGH